MKLKGKVTLITGGATGIGRASSQLFAKEGARIIIVDINENGGHDTVDKIKDTGGEAVFFRADLSSVSEIEEMIRKAVSNYGRLDIFFHNAGVAGPGSLENTSEPDYDRTMAVNLKAGFFGARCAVPHLRASGGGCILFTSSGLGLRPPSVQSPTYSITKAGLIMLTRVLAVALADYNIRVNAVCPGPIDSTPLFDDFAKQNPGVEPEEYRQRTIAARPIRRFGTPEEVAAGALFLVSSDSSYITGIALAIDGGAAAA